MPGRRGFAIAAATVALVVAAAGTAVHHRVTSTADDFVTRSGPAFRLGGRPFRFVGFNLYDAAASDVYSCSPGTRLDDAGLDRAMAYVRDRAGGTVVRFWAYQTYTAGGRDFTGVDRVLRAARRHGLRVIPVLEDGPGQCSTGTPDVAKSVADNGDWYTDGYRRPYGSARLSFRDYARVMAEHYRDNPTIMAWMMTNEAETTMRGPDATSVLVPFARDVATVIHAADPHHLVTLGTQANGAPGASGADFQAVYGQPGLDFAEVHDWARYGSDAAAMPGSAGGRLPDPGSDECRSVSAPIACSFAIAGRLGLPLVVGEAGIAATDTAGRARRAGQLSAKLRAAFAAGADGYLVWQLNTANTDGYAVVPGQGDPVTGVLAAQARRLEH